MDALSLNMFTTRLTAALLWRYAPTNILHLHFEQMFLITKESTFLLLLWSHFLSCRLLLFQLKFLDFLQGSTLPFELLHILYTHIQWFPQRHGRNFLWAQAGLFNSKTKIKKKVLKTKIFGLDADLPRDKDRLSRAHTRSIVLGLVLGRSSGSKLTGIYKFVTDECICSIIEEMDIFRDMFSRKLVKDNRTVR